MFNKMKSQSIILEKYLSEPGKVCQRPHGRRVAENRYVILTDADDKAISITGEPKNPVGQLAMHVQLS
jgi:hypothetical protein